VGGARRAARRRRNLLTAWIPTGYSGAFDCERTRLRIRRGDNHSPVIASAATAGPDVRQCLKRRSGRCSLAASIFHYGTYTVSDLKEQLDRHGIHVRKTVCFPLYRLMDGQVDAKASRDAREEALEGDAPLVMIEKFWTSDNSMIEPRGAIGRGSKRDLVKLSHPARLPRRGG